MRLPDARVAIHAALTIALGWVRWVRRVNGWFAMHLLLTSVVAGWAIILWLPLDTFGNSNSYARFRAINPNETYWATGFALASLVGALGCWAARPRIPPVAWHGPVRMLSAALLGINHGMIALLMGTSNPASTSTATFVPIMVAAWALAAVEADRIA